jgi:hypothetical protein
MFNMLNKYETTCRAGDMAAADMETKIAHFENLLERLSEVVSHMEETEGELVMGEADTAEDDEEEDDDDDYATIGRNPVVTEYEALIQRLLVPFLEAVNGIGGDVQKQGAYVAQVFGAQREMLVQVSWMTSACSSISCKRFDETRHRHEL